MRKLSLNILLLCVSIFVFAQKNPHGYTASTNCLNCHNTESWNFTSTNFSHDTTGFVLEGEHKNVSCSSCHPTLEFSKATSNCTDCHTDMHSGTVGLDCDRCHDNKSWIIENTTELHELSRFPLLGSHKMADCSSCHTSASNLTFDPLGAECIDCHRNDYLATTTPNHAEAGFSVECMDCHKIDASEWSSSGINHDFFPLVKGHAIKDCALCHTNGFNTPLSTDCFSCHQKDYTSAANPNHQNLGFDTNCTQCHTIDPGWKPAEFRDHDAVSFPIYSGKHKNEWNDCSSCHTQADNYSLFSCVDCHEHNRSKMDSEHRGVGGYAYSSPSCYACHPTGDGESAFNHSATGFPLAGLHGTADCASCHTSGYSGTSNLCSDCHLADYNSTSNPNHQSVGYSMQCENCHKSGGPGWESIFDHNATGFPLAGLHATTDCASCHTSGYAGTSSLCSDCHLADYNSTSNPNHQSIGLSKQCEDCHKSGGPDWEPAGFPNHNDRYALNGAHNTISTDCFLCHQGNYNSTPNTCFGCHSNDYQSATNPNHATSNFSTDCETCHSENAWKPSTFDHDGQYFPIYSGKHRGEWNSCSDCHNQPSDFSAFSCTNCHEHSQSRMQSKHQGVSGFVYNSANCLACHPTGRE